MKGGSIASPAAESGVTAIPRTRLRLRFVPRAVLAALLLACLALMALGIRSLAAPKPGRLVSLGRVCDGGQLALKLDLQPGYGSAPALFDGGLCSPNGELPALNRWGLRLGATWSGKNCDSFCIIGAVPAQSMKLTNPTDADAWYHLVLGPITPDADGMLYLRLPWTTVAYARAVPPPANMGQLRAADTVRVPSTAAELRYPLHAAQPLTIDIPFSPLHRALRLELTPLIDSLRRGDPAAFRVSGSITVDNVQSYGDFARLCDTRAVTGAVYLAGTVVSAIDAPPALTGNVRYDRLYEEKPAAITVAPAVRSCTFGASGGRVEATFEGRVTRAGTRPGLADFPRNPPWVGLAPGQVMPEFTRSCAALSGAASSAVAQQCQAGDGPAGEYALGMGAIVLAPGDELRVNMPGSALDLVWPPPAEFDYARSTAPVAVYRGPALFPLQLLYRPGAALVLRQTPAVLRTEGDRAAHGLEQPIATVGGTNALRNPTGPARRWLVGLFPLRVPWAAVPLAAALALVPLARRVQRQRLRQSLSALLWAAAGVAAAYTLRGPWGLILLAVLAHGVRRGRADAPRTAVAAAVVFTGQYLDGRTAAAFSPLSGFGLNSTPATPTIVAGVGLALIAAFAWGRRGSLPEQEDDWPAIALLLAALASADVLARSLPALALLGLGMAALLLPRRGAGTLAALRGPRIAGRCRRAWRGWLVPAGAAVLVLVAVQNGLPSASAVVGASAGVAAPVLGPALLLCSVAESFAALGLLFLIVYPLLPTRAGYAKAVIFALFFLALYALGIGADNRLIFDLEMLAVGRFIYYLSVPLLIALYLDISDSRDTEHERHEETIRAALVVGAPPEHLEPEEGFAASAGAYLQRLRGRMNALGGIVALAAPSLYALFSGVPLVTTYFDVLNRLLVQGR